MTAKMSFDSRHVIRNSCSGPYGHFAQTAAGVQPDSASIVARGLASTLSNGRGLARWVQPLGVRGGCRARARYQMGPKNGTGTFWQRPAGRSHAAAAIVW